jgi:hypothetical protein
MNCLHLFSSFENFIIQTVLYFLADNYAGLQVKWNTNYAAKQCVSSSERDNPTHIRQKVNN